MKDEVAGRESRPDARGAFCLPLNGLRGKFRSILIAPRPELVDPSGPVLLLGSWCEPVCKDVSGLTYSVLPNPWDNRACIAKAEAYCWDFCQRLFPQLGARLNSLHGTNHPLRYWEVLLASWLMHAVHVMYDRYLIAQDARQVAPDAVVTVPRSAGLRPPSTGTDWLSSIEGDSWNLDCFVKLFEILGQPIRYLDIESVDQRKRKTTGASWAYRLRQSFPENFLTVTSRGLERVLGNLVFSKPSTTGDILLAASYHLKPRDWIWLKRSVPGLDVVANTSWQPTSRVDCDQEGRSRLAGLAFASEFERVFVDLVPTLIPSCYVENYREVCEAAYTRFGKLLKNCVVDGNVFYGDNLPLLEYMARCAAAGYALITIQHGGGYGNSGTRSQERLEIETADEFLSWGWREDDGHRKVLPLPDPHLSRVRDRHRGGQDIVLTECEFPRYAYRLMSCPIAGQFAAHRNGLAQYVAALPKSLREQVRYKRYHVDYGWGSLPEPLDVLRHDWPGKPYRASKWNQYARLAVVTYPDTAFIEALALNVPTIGFWNPGLWEMRAEAQPYFDVLEKAGVVHYDPVNAAAKTVEVYEQAGEWWAMPQVQRARLAFLDRYGLNSPNWRQAWREFLSTLAKDDQRHHEGV